MYDYTAERKKNANYMIQFTPEEELLCAHDICEQYGIKSSADTPHTSFIEHLMILYALQNKEKMIADISWSSSGARSFYYYQSIVEACLKAFYRSQGCARKGRIELDNAAVKGSYNSEYCFFSAKASVFKLLDTKTHSWSVWGEPEKKSKKDGKQHA